MTYRLEIPPRIVDLLAEVAARESAAMTDSSGELFTVALEEVALPILERECLKLLGRPFTGRGRRLAFLEERPWNRSFVLRSWRR